jgi:hypothetical protein
MIKELEALARAVIGVRGQLAQIEAEADYRAAANPQAVLKLIEVIKAQHEVVAIVANWDLDYLRSIKALRDMMKARDLLAKANELGVG